MRFCLLGYGRWGRTVARTLARTGELVAIVDISAHRRNEAAGTWGAWGVRTYNDLADANRAREFDAVWVATPTADHNRAVKEALAAGYHVLCEKPFMLHLAHAQDAVQLARENDVALMVGHLTLHTGRHDYLRSLTIRGQQPKAIHAIRRNTEASLSDGSVLAGIGPHEISPLLDLYGIPEWVACKGTIHRTEFRFKWEEDHELVATVELDWLAEKRHRQLTADNTRITAPDDQEPLVREAEAFIRACKGQDREKWLEDALQTTEVLERLEQYRLDVEDLTAGP